MAILCSRSADDQAKLFFGVNSEFICRERFHQYITLMNELKQWGLGSEDLATMTSDIYKTWNTITVKQCMQMLRRKRLLSTQ